MVREIAGAVLESGGFAVVAVGNADAAQAAFEADPDRFGALVTDIQLQSPPNGWRLAEDLRDIRPGLPILYMSGGNAHEWAARGVPGSLLLPKPFGADSLLTALARLLAFDGTDPGAGANIVPAAVI